MGFLLGFSFVHVVGVDFIGGMKEETLMMQWTDLSNSESVLKAGGGEAELPGVKCKGLADVVCTYKPSF